MLSTGLSHTATWMFLSWTNPDPLRLVVFKHGGISYVSQNTALCEDFASHGFVLLSLTHLDGSSGILYPNGNTSLVDDACVNDVFAAFAPDPDGVTSPDIAKAKRYGVLIMPAPSSTLHAGEMTTSR